MPKTRYKFNMNVKYKGLEVIRVPDIVRKCRHKWFNQSLCEVNSSVLRLGIFEGEFHMHKHERDDEVFFVLDGSLIMESEKGIFRLGKYEGICIPKGVAHRPVAKKKTVVLMIENTGIVPAGD